MWGKAKERAKALDKDKVMGKAMARVNAKLSGMKRRSMLKEYKGFWMF
jgi:hypothetical protein